MEISVIVPVYNAEKLIERSLISLVNQTFNSFEVILINDESTDNTMEIVNSVVKVKPSIFKVINQKNTGVSGARNNGLKQAKGKYIFFMDSDDYLESSALALMYDYAENNELDLLIDGFHTVTEEGVFLKEYDVAFDKKYEVILPSDSKNLFFIENSVWNKLFLKQIITSNNILFEEGLWYEDLLFIRQYYIYSRRAMVISANSYRYVQHPESIMSTMGSVKNFQILTIFEKLIEFYRGQELFEEYSEYIEFIAIQNILLASVVRLCKSKQFAYAKDMKKKFLTMFPKYKENKFVKKLNLKHKILLVLVRSDQFRLIELLFRKKG